MPDWSPTDYLKFVDERSRPALDLLQRLPLQNPTLVYDLGCGPGNSTALLVDRFARAEIIGVDNSPAMIEAARVAVSNTQLELADLNAWTQPRQADLLFSNATLQWLPNHIAVMQRWLEALPQDGVLAVQMPDNLSEPSHALMRVTAEDMRWKSALETAAQSRVVLPSPDVYYDALRPLCSTLEIWHTVYNHALDGAAGIVSMFQSTGLRPFLAPLNEVEKQAFLAGYEKRLGDAYPVQSDGKVLLRFPRLFIVAQK